jgi:hypothetical protein
MTIHTTAVPLRIEMVILDLDWHPPRPHFLDFLSVFASTTKIRVRHQDTVFIVPLHSATISRDNNTIMKMFFVAWTLTTAALAAALGVESTTVRCDRAYLWALYDLSVCVHVLCCCCCCCC